MIVADASVVVPALVDPGPLGVAVARRLASDDVAAPELLDVEVIHALRSLVIGGRVDAAQAGRATTLLPQLPIERFPHRMLLPRIWELRDNLTAYDAAYVALAELLGAALVTGDQKLLGAPGVRCSIEVVG